MYLSRVRSKNKKENNGTSHLLETGYRIYNKYYR